MPMPTKEKVLEYIHIKCQGLCVDAKFDIPSLRVGTLDTLMSLSDDLVKADSFVEQTTRKIGLQLHLLLGDGVDRKKGGNILTVEGANIDLYLSRFKWYEAKYPIRMSCRELTEVIQGQVGKIDDEFRIKLTTYNVISNTLSQAERKRGGTLLIRELGDIIRKEHVVESEYLTTLFVVIGTHNLKDWMAKYETLSDYVVPKSSQIILQETDCTLVNVVLFRRAVDEFKTKARELRFQVRDFKFDSTVEAGVDAHKKLVDEREQIKNKLLLWCKANFGEAFIAWTHLKAIRTHVESILRYGLPANYQAVLLNVKSGSEKKLRTALNDLFATQTSFKADKGKDQDDAASVAAGIIEPFYPYVFFEMNLDMAPK